MTTRYKTIEFGLKRTPTDGSGRFMALVSTFGGRPDAQGDVILPGAYADTIRDWKNRDRSMVLYWQHEYRNPEAAIGTILSMKETREGLVIEGQLDLTNPFAVRIYERMLAKTVGEFSIGYHVAPGDEEEVGGVRYIRKVELLEISVVSLGANRETQLLAIKSAPTKFLRLERAKNRIDAALAGVPNHNRAGEVQDVGRYVAELRYEIARDRAREAVRAKARERLRMHHEQNADTAATRVMIDPRTMRVIRSDDDARDRERVAREMEEMSARAQEREEGLRAYPEPGTPVPGVTYPLGRG